MENDDKKKTVFAVMEFLESSEHENTPLKLVAPVAHSKREERPEIDNYLEIINSYMETEFKKNFRMTKTTCDVVIQKFSQSQFAPISNHGGLECISAALDIYSFLWFCGNKCCIRDVSSRFGMGELTFIGVCTRVIRFLNNIAPGIICFPLSDEGKQQVADEFEEVAQFRGVVGCIDGTYIPMRTLAHKIKSTYVNRHDMTSLTLQGICDVKKKFLDVFTGTSSKIHDARIFRLSFISKQINEICDNGRWHLLGDAAYPLRPYLLTPYRDYANLSINQTNYNYRLSATRVKIENAFGLLKQQFRQLIRTEFFTVEKTADFVIAVCVLHNLFIMQNDNWDDECDYGTGPFQPANTDSVSKSTLRADGENKRKEICNYLANL